MKSRFLSMLYCLVVVGVAMTLVAACQYQGDDRFAREASLNARQPPDQVMDAIGVAPGMVIGEIGAGRGRYTVRLAARVGSGGMVYANDINAGALAVLNRRCIDDGIENVETILGTVVEPNLPEGALDMAFMVSVYHHLDRPTELLRNVAPALKPDGILVIVEREPEKSHAPPQSSTPVDELLAQAEEAGYELVRIETFLPEDNIYILRLRIPGD